MSSSTEFQHIEKIDQLPSLEAPIEAPDTKMRSEAYDRDSTVRINMRAEQQASGTKLDGLFNLVEYNARGGNDFDYRRQGGRSYDFRPYLSNVYGCSCDGNGGGCSCWDRSRNYFNQDTNPNKMVCGLDAEGKYHGPASWNQRLFGGRQARDYNSRSSSEYDPNHMICGLDASGRYHGPKEWEQRLFGNNPERRSVCGPGGCYPMDQSRNYYHGRHSAETSGLGQSSQFYGDRSGLARGTHYRSNNDDGSGQAGDCNGGGCNGGGNKGLARNLISRLLGFFRRR